MPKVLGLLFLGLVINFDVNTREPSRVKSYNPNYDRELIRRARESTTCKENIALRDLGYMQKL